MRFNRIKTKAQYIKNKLEYTVLKDLVTSCQMYYDPNLNQNQTTLVEDPKVYWISTRSLVVIG